MQVYDPRAGNPIQDIARAVEFAANVAPQLQPYFNGAANGLKNAADGIRNAYATGPNGPSMPFNNPRKRRDPFAESSSKKKKTSSGPFARTKFYRGGFNNRRRIPRKKGIKLTYRRVPRRVRRRKSTSSLASFNYHGSTIKVERSGSVTSGQCIYIGHSTYVRSEMLKALCRCVVKELFTQSGEQIERFDDVWGGQTDIYRIVTYYFKGNSTHSADEDCEFLEIEYAPGIGLTYKEIAENLNSQWAGLVAGDPDVNIYKVLYRKNWPGTGVDIKATVYTNQMSVTWQAISALTFQNVTAGKSYVDETVDSKLSMDNIENNPLRYKHYGTSGKSGFTYKYKRQPLTAETVVVGFVPNESSGIITYDPTVHQNMNLYKPPLASSFLGKVTATGGVISPGWIKKDKISSLVTQSFKACWDKIKYEYDVPARNKIVHSGRASMIGFEHVLKNATSDAAIKVEYQQDFILRMKYSYKRLVMTEEMLNITN